MKLATGDHLNKEKVPIITLNLKKNIKKPTNSVSNKENNTEQLYNFNYTICK